eukprot:2370254-Alexandrium_andersonii.AAC.1
MLCARLAVVALPQDAEHVLVADEGGQVLGHILVDALKDRASLASAGLGAACVLLVVGVENRLADAREPSEKDVRHGHGQVRAGKGAVGNVG